MHKGVVASSGTKLAPFPLIPLRFFQRLLRGYPQEMINDVRISLSFLVK
jgi:hypothetical protein